MGLRVLWKMLDAAKVDIGAIIASDGANYTNPFQLLTGCLNAAYEYLFDDVAPGQTGSQTYEGHDHGLIGPPITRGCVYCQDWGNSAFINFQPSASNWNTWRSIGADNAVQYDRPFIYEVSPRLPAPTVLEAWIHYSCNVDFEIRFVEQNTPESLAQDQNKYQLATLPGGETSRWLRIPYVPANPGNINYLRMNARAKGYDANNVPVLSLFAMIIDETPATTLPPDGSVPL